MRRINRSVLLLLTVLFISSLTAGAQQRTPQYIVDAATELANRAIPGLGFPNGFTHVIHPLTDDSSMGCPLVEDEKLRREVIPYEVNLLYGDVSYRVFVAADDSLTQLCDPKFPVLDFRIKDDGDEDGDGILNGEDTCIYTAGVPNELFNGCPFASEGDRDGDGIADINDLCLDQPGAIAANGCPLFPDTDDDDVPDIIDTCPDDPGSLFEMNVPPGCPPDGSGTSPEFRGADDLCFVIAETPLDRLYLLPDPNAEGIRDINQGESLPVIGRSFDSVWYLTPDGWIFGGNAQLRGGCFNIPITDNTSDEQPDSTCFLRAATTLSNVRAQPTTESAIITEIFPNREYGIIGANEDETWYQINPGWVAAQVAKIGGICDRIGAPPLGITGADQPSNAAP